MKVSATHIDRAALRIRAHLFTTRVEMANQLRGLLKLFCLRMGKVTTYGKRSASMFPKLRDRMLRRKAYP